MTASVPKSSSALKCHDKHESEKQAFSSTIELSDTGSNNVQKRIKDESTKNSLLRSTGLKAISDGNFLRPKLFRDCEEPPKVLISTSRRILLSRLGVHLLPVTLSILLIALNAAEILNGPDISTLARFGLQVASKFHELTIGGSCTTIVLDVIRFQLVRDGISLGLLSSGFSVVGLNFLWSPEFLSIIRTRLSVLTKIWLGCVIVTACVLISVVGPASALLFTPTQVWKQSARAEFYVGGNEQQLWPTHLTSNHTGPAICQQNPSSALYSCPYGGYRSLFNTLGQLPSPAFQVILSDWSVRREMKGRTYSYPAGVAESAETWAYTSRCDVASLLNDMNYKYAIAQSYATGRNRRLRDFNSGSYYITEEKIPVGRSVCGPSVVIQNDTRALPFPVLDPDRAWRNKSLGPFQTQGKVEYFPIANLLHTNTTQSNQISSKWLALNSTFGAATAGLVIMAQNDTTTVGRTCTLDCRWALGQTFLRPSTTFATFEVQLGKPSKLNGNVYLGADYADFFDPAVRPWYGETIKADQQWLDAISPKFISTDDGTGYNISAFDALLALRGGDSMQMMSPDPLANYDAVVMHEYTSTAFLIDALARTNWALTLHFPDQRTINPILQQLLPGNQNMLNGNPIFAPPDNTNTPSSSSPSYSTLTATWHNYGTAWTLTDVGQWIAVQILSFHILVAIIHCIITCSRTESMEAWDSIVELVVLAWNSEPRRRDGDGEMRNCGAGIYRGRTLETKVRVVALEDEDDGKEGDVGSNARDGKGEKRKKKKMRVELVVVDEQGNSKDGRAVKRVQPSEKYS